MRLGLFQIRNQTYRVVYSDFLCGIGLDFLFTAVVRGKPRFRNVGRTAGLARSDRGIKITISLGSAADCAIWFLALQNTQNTGKPVIRNERFA